MLSNFMTPMTHLHQCLQSLVNYLLSYCVLQFPAPSAPPPVQRPGAVPQAPVSHVQDGECPHAEVNILTTLCVEKPLVRNSISSTLSHSLPCVFHMSEDFIEIVHNDQEQEEDYPDYPVT